jgi:hypothetical protein
LLKDQLRDEIAQIKVPDVVPKGTTPEERRLERARVQADQETLLERGSIAKKLVC